MQPEQQPQHPIDYLDSIATVPKNAGKGPSDRFFFGAIIAAALVALVVGGFVLLAGRGDGQADLSTLSVRLKNLQEIADDNQKNIVSSKLRGTNTNLSLVLANANRDISAELTASGIAANKIDAEIVARENTDELEEILEDARLNGIFDRIYSREMAYELETLLILIAQLEEDTKSTSQQEFLTTTYDNLAPLQESFAKFDAASS